VRQFQRHKSRPRGSEKGRLRWFNRSTCPAELPICRIHASDEGRLGNRAELTCFSMECDGSQARTRRATHLQLDSVIRKAKGHQKRASRSQTFPCSAKRDDPTPWIRFDAGSTPNHPLTDSRRSFASPALPLSSPFAHSPTPRYLFVCPKNGSILSSFALNPLFLLSFFVRRRVQSHSPQASSLLTTSCIYHFGPSVCTLSAVCLAVCPALCSIRPSTLVDRYIEASPLTRRV
jgi:hypothetical protein